MIMHACAIDYEGEIVVVNLSCRVLTVPGVNFEELVGGRLGSLKCQPNCL